MLADAGHTFSVHKLRSRNKELDLTDLSPSLEAEQPCQHSTKPGGRVYVLWLHAMLLRQYRASYWVSISSGTVLCNWTCARWELSGVWGCFVAFWVVLLLLLVCVCLFLKCIVVGKAGGGGFLVLLASELAMDLVLFTSTGHFVQAMRGLSCAEFCGNALWETWSNALNFHTGHTHKKKLLRGGGKSCSLWGGHKEFNIEIINLVLLECSRSMCNSPVSKAEEVDISYSECSIPDYPASLGYTKHSRVY